MNAHFIEIDTILKTDAKPWIVDKEQPNIPLLKIDISDFKLFKSGIFKSQSNKINFNGKTFWLSNNFMNKVKAVVKKNNSDIYNIGISMQEFLNPAISNKLNFEINTTIFNNIINTNEDIYVICSKKTKENYNTQIIKLEEELKKIGLIIKKYYFISETFFNKNSDNIAYLKTKLILQHLIGKKTNGDIFTDEDIRKYNLITYYDDNMKSIEVSKKINNILDKLLLKTDNITKLDIKKIIKDNDCLLYIKELTNNRSKPFIEYNTSLVYSNVIKKFESWNYL